MNQHFSRDGVSFRFPVDWQLQREENDEGWAVTVSSPGTAFFLLSLRTDGVEPVEMAETVLETLREDYPDLEAEARVETVAGLPAIGHDIRFFSLDLSNTSWTRTFNTPGGPVLILCQFSDLDAEMHEPELRDILESVQVDD